MKKQIILIFILGVIAIEIGAHAFWTIQFSLPFFDSSRILYAFYPRLKKIDMLQPSAGDEFFDVLLLGGSVLNENWGTVEQELDDQLTKITHHQIRVFNLAQPGHTSRDSLLKYQAISKAQFELVIYYHGINEVRANNIAPEFFDENYNHYGWYSIVNAMAEYHNKSYFALPYTWQYLRLSLRRHVHGDQFVPENQPRGDWLKYGEDYRSAKSLKVNLSNVINLAKQRGERLLLMTFAYHIPSNYTLKAFRQKKLDYRIHMHPVEIWGLPQNVIGALKAHNDVITELANSNHEIIFVDQENLLTHSAGNFNDACHLTPEGSEEFVENIIKSMSFAQ